LAGKYRITGLLGEGGMGRVWAATHEGLDQKVAVKILTSSDLDTNRRFDREARALARLRSEHVVRTFDVGSLDDGRRYMVMEHLDGTDLGTLIDRGEPFSVETVVRHVLQACEGIADAHAQGIVHRDLKPANLFLTTTVDGRPLVKILDFGISKVEGVSQELKLTQTTEVIGSPSYMSPEQLVSSRDVDHRTDIWSLGVVLYELFTGALPFEARTITELAIMVERDREVPVHERRSDVPQELSEVISRCLCKRPEERFASVIELVDALIPFSTTSSVAIRVRGVAAKSGRNSIVPGSAPALPASDDRAAAARAPVDDTFSSQKTERLPPSGAALSVRAKPRATRAVAFAVVFTALGVVAGGLAIKASSNTGAVTSPSVSAGAEPTKPIATEVATVGVVRTLPTALPLTTPASTDNGAKPTKVADRPAERPRPTTGPAKPSVTVPLYGRD